MEGNLHNKVVLIYNAISNGNDVVSLGADRQNMGGTYVDVEADHVKELKLGRARGSYGCVVTITMDDLLKLPAMNDFRNVVIKMDIEGFEERALQQSSNFFKIIRVPAILLEWVFHSNQMSGLYIIRLLTELQYIPFSLEGLSLDIKASSKWPDDILWLHRNETDLNIFK